MLLNFPHSDQKCGPLCLWKLNIPSRSHLEYFSRTHELILLNHKSIDGNRSFESNLSQHVLFHTILLLSENVEISRVF